MWQQIQSNKRKTIILIIFMALLMLGIGYAGAAYSFGLDNALIGIVVAFIAWLILFLTAYFKGDNILLAMNGAKKITHDDNPKLFNVVEEMTLAAGLPKIPDIYIIDEQAPNAFATGRSPDKAAVAVTAGLLQILNRDELQAVIAHEMAHIKNRDTLYMIFVGIMLSSIFLLSDLFLRTRFRSRRSGSSSSSNVEVVILIVCLILLLLSPFIAQLIYYSISRKREYLADACAAQFTRYPVALADALAKISGCSIQLKSASKYTASMYIVNPLAFCKKLKVIKDVTSTHPSTAERIKILYKMAGADVAAYNNAFEDVVGKKSNLFSQNLLSSTEPIALVASTSSASANILEKVERRREVEDMLWKMNNYSFHECSCGTKIKTPPEYKGQTIACPHCKTEFLVK